jgi:hypothetical protein
MTSPHSQLWVDTYLAKPGIPPEDQVRNGILLLTFALPDLPESIFVSARPLVEYSRLRRAGAVDKCQR